MNRLMRIALGVWLVAASGSAVAHWIHVFNATDRDIEVEFAHPLCKNGRQVVPANASIDYPTHNPKLDLTKMGCELSKIDINSAGFTGSAVPLSTRADAQFLIEFNRTSDNIMITPFRNHRSKNNDVWKDSVERAQNNLRIVQANKGKIAELRRVRDAAIDRLDAFSFALHAHQQGLDSAVGINRYNAEVEAIRRVYRDNVNKVLNLDIPGWGR